MRVRKVSTRSLSDNDCFQRRDNKQPLVMRSQRHHHVRRRILADANAGPMRVLPGQIEHLLHISLASVWCLLVQPERESVRRIYLRTNKSFSQWIGWDNLASMIIAVPNYKFAQARPFARR